jgi:hypothetical protein
MKTSDEFFEDIERLGEQVAVEIDAMDATRRELDSVIKSQPRKDSLRLISATLNIRISRLRELVQALWFRTAGLKRLLGGDNRST